MTLISVTKQRSLPIRTVLILIAQFIPFNCSMVDFSLPKDEYYDKKKLDTRFNNTLLQPKGFYISMREESDKIEHVKFIIFLRRGDSKFRNKLVNKDPDISQDVYEKNGLLWEYSNHDVEVRAGTYVLYRIKYVLKSKKVRITDTRFFQVGMERGKYVLISGGWYD